MFKQSLFYAGKRASMALRVNKSTINPLLFQYNTNFRIPNYRLFSSSAVMNHGHLKKPKPGEEYVKTIISLCVVLRVEI